MERFNIYMYSFGYRFLDIIGILIDSFDVFTVIYNLEKKNYFHLMNKCYKTNKTCFEQM